jgi:arylformamidase
MSNEIDRLYDAKATVGATQFAAYMARYREASSEAVDGIRGTPGIVYDASSGERLDVWGTDPEDVLRPAFVFIHGGYWRALSRHDSSFMARSLAAHGIATVAVDYTLSPHATLDEIVRQVRSAVAWVFHHGADYGLDPTRIVVGGHSAGGHLTGMTLLDDWQKSHGLPPDVVHGAMPISGLFDLRPLVDSFVNEWLALTPADAWNQSPMRSIPQHRRPTCTVVPANDAPGFLLQAHEFHRRWNQGQESHHPLVVAANRNHYDVVLDLTDPQSTLTQHVVALCR